jgi:hypothetical protein
MFVKLRLLAMPFSDRNNVTPSRATKRVEIKLTEQEHWVTSQRAAQYNLSLTEFIRRKTIGTRLPQSVGDVFLKVSDHLQRLEAQLNRINQSIHEARSQNAPVIISSTFSQDIKSLRTLMRRIRGNINPG